MIYFTLALTTFLAVLPMVIIILAQPIDGEIL